MPPMSKSPISDEPDKFTVLKILSICVLQFSIFTNIFTYLVSDDPQASNFYSALELFDEKKKLKDFVGVVFWTARPVGALVMGWASDRYGRIKTLNFSLTLQCVALFFTMIAFSTRILTCTCFFLGLLAAAGVFECVVVLCECSGKSKNKLICEIMAWASLGAIFGSVFWVFRVNWRLVVLSNFFIALVSLKCFNFIFQSNQPIFSLGKKFKGEEFDDRSVKSEENGRKFWGWYENKMKLLTGLAIWINFVVFEYQVADEGVEVFEGAYWDAAFFALGEMISLWILWKFGDSVKRKYFFVGFALNRIFFLTFTILLKSFVARIAVYSLIKCGLCIEMCLIFRFTLELLPSENKNAGFGAFYLIAKIFTVFINKFKVFPIIFSILISLSIK